MQRSFLGKVTVLLCHILKRRGIKSILHACVTTPFGCFWRVLVHTTLASISSSSVNQAGLTLSSSLLLLLSPSLAQEHQHNEQQQPHLSRRRSRQNNLCPSTPVLCLRPSYLPFCISNRANCFSVLQHLSCRDHFLNFAFV